MALRAASVGATVPGTCSSGSVGAFSASKASASKLYQSQGVQFRKSLRGDACVCEVSDHNDVGAGDASSCASGALNSRVLCFEQHFWSPCFSCCGHWLGNSWVVRCLPS